MDLGITGNVALDTWGSRGLGRAFARKYRRTPVRWQWAGMGVQHLPPVVDTVDVPGPEIDPFAVPELAEH